MAAAKGLPQLPERSAAVAQRLEDEVRYLPLPDMTCAWMMRSFASARYVPLRAVTQCYLPLRDAATPAVAYRCVPLRDRWSGLRSRWRVRRSWRSLTIHRYRHAATCRRVLLRRRYVAATSPLRCRFVAATLPLRCRHAIAFVTMP